MLPLASASLLFVDLCTLYGNHWSNVHYSVEIPTPSQAIILHSLALFRGSQHFKVVWTILCNWFQWALKVCRMLWPVYLIWDACCVGNAGDHGRLGGRGVVVLSCRHHIAGELVSGLWWVWVGVNPHCVLEKWSQIPQYIMQSIVTSLSH